MTSRTLAAASALVGLLSSTQTVAAGFPLSNDASSLAVCQDTIRVAAERLGIDTNRALSACLTRAIGCLVDASGGDSDCCQVAATRCHDDLARIDEAVGRFGRYVLNRRCGVVSFADIASSTGLGYGDLANACGALSPPASIADLAGLTDCLARLIVADAACFVGTRELPRGIDALGCGDLQTQVAAAIGTDLRACNAAPCSPSPVPTQSPVPSPSPTPVAHLCQTGDRIVVAASVDRPYAGALVDLAYPPTSVDLPGTGAIGSVSDRVAFAASGLTAVNDHDTSGDLVDDTLTATLVGLDDNPAGQFIAVTFDCLVGAAPPTPSAFTCAASASDSGGQAVLENCSLTVTGP